MVASLFLLPGFTFVLELIAFLLVLAFVAKYVLPPLRKAMADREAQIRNSIQAAEDLRHDAEQSSRQRRELLEAARVEARQIVDQAGEIAEQLRDEGRRRGQEEYERLLEAARGEIAVERERARAELLNELGAVVLDAAERVIGGALDEDRHRALVDDAISAARSSAGVSGGAPGEAG